ncbi:M10 family metallopeptidase C-terminal domain-containing protein [Sphingomonas sp. GV3]|uniref:M10 family metallopeptidase C-terminal domain-containing protein n=1 Tax=Sphingomonas sp. GV3 TaxID=3040671 RepID=UPI00280A77F0|nr:M10 family metallopeptidase C-terminal domain-containing protein [Sphingomonas sp. GV3]
MMKAVLPTLAVVVAGASVAATLSLAGSISSSVSTSSVAVIGGTSVQPIASKVDTGNPLATPACSTLTSSAGAIGPAPGTTGCGPASHTTLQDRVWFGAYWQLLKEPIVLGGGYVNARIDRSSDGNFYDGIVEKVDASGQVTDVILAFAGAQGGTDVLQGESILAGIPLDEATRATNVYESLLREPRYSNARIHVTGHSLGTGYTQYVLAYALATHGVAATDARADFLGFGAPNWLQSSAAHFGVDPTLAAARMVDFTAANDPVLINGVVRIGINNYLPAFTGLPGLGVAFDAIAAHFPTTYAAALGLPDWLSPEDAANATAELSAQFQTGNSISPTYGPAGRLPLTVDGSAGSEWLQGLGGDDRLTGHEGADVLTGGAGSDTFVYLTRTDSGNTRSSEDLVSDFSQAEGDRIDLSALSVQRPLLFNGIGTPAVGQVGVRYDNGETLVQINLSGSGAPDMIIRLTGLVSLTSNDFVLTALGRS